MRMSDVFDLPMFMDGNSAVISNDHRYSIEFDDSDSDVGYQVELVCSAINNHDRLTEENAKLRDALTNLVGRGERFINLDEIRFDLDSDDIASIESNFNESLIDAEELLNQLKDQNNDK